MYSACHVNFIISISCNTDRWPVVLHLKKKRTEKQDSRVDKQLCQGVRRCIQFKSNWNILWDLHGKAFIACCFELCLSKNSNSHFLWSSSVTFITHRLKLLLGCLGQFREVQATQRQRHRHKNKRMLAACGQRKMRREEKKGGWMYGWMDEVWRKEWDCQKRWGGTGVFFT